MNGLTTDDINLILSCLSFSIRAIASNEAEKTERTIDIGKIQTYRIGKNIRIDIILSGKPSPSLLNNPLKE